MTMTRMTVPCPPQGLPELTETEIFCLALIAEGMRIDRAAQALDLPRERVDLVLHAAQEKLGAGNLLQAVSRAMLAGQIGKDDISDTE